MTAPIQHLSDIDLLGVSGPDGAAFLQSLLSNDLRALDNEKNAQWTALLTPQGRVIALMALIRIGEQEFLLAVPRQRGEAIRQTLQRFVLRRKLSLDNAAGYALVGTLGREPAAAGTLLSLEFRCGRRWHLTTAAEAGNFPPAGDDWQRRDLEDGLAFLDAGASEKFLAHAIGLQWLPAISVSKGCYPGQEIVTRSHFLGKSKRHLALLDSSNSNAAEPPAVGAPLNDAEGRHVGDVVAAVAGAAANTLLVSLTDAGLRSKLLLPEIAGNSPIAELRLVFEQT